MPLAVIQIVPEPHLGIGETEVVEDHMGGGFPPGVLLHVQRVQYLPEVQPNFEPDQPLAHIRRTVWVAPRAVGARQEQKTQGPQRRARPPDDSREQKVGGVEFVRVILPKLV